MMMAKSKEEYIRAFKERFGIDPSDEELQAFIEIYESKKEINKDK